MEDPLSSPVRASPSLNYLYYDNRDRRENQIPTKAILS